MGLLSLYSRVRAILSFWDIKEHIWARTNVRSLVWKFENHFWIENISKIEVAPIGQSLLSKITNRDS